MYCFIKSGHDKFLLNDNLCLFRCLAVFLSKKQPKKCETEATKFADIYCDYRGIFELHGVSLGELEFVENCFDVGIKVYTISGEDIEKTSLCRIAQEDKKKWCLSCVLVQEQSLLSN